MSIELSISSRRRFFISAYFPLRIQGNESSISRSSFLRSMKLENRFSLILKAFCDRLGETHRQLIGWMRTHSYITHSVTNTEPVGKEQSKSIDMPHTSYQIPTSNFEFSMSTSNIQTDLHSFWPKFYLFLLAICGMCFPTPKI